MCGGKEEDSEEKRGLGWKKKRGNWKEVGSEGNGKQRREGKDR